MVVLWLCLVVVVSARNATQPEHTTGHLDGSVPASHQLKVVEKIFCRGFNGECENVPSWQELEASRIKHEQEQREAIEQQRVRDEQDTAEAIRIAGLKLPPIGAPKNYIPGEIVPRIPHPHVLDRGEVRSGNETGSPHHGSRLGAYYPNGYNRPPVIRRSENGTDVEEIVVVDPSPSPPPRQPWGGYLWVNSPNRFPHQREEFHRLESLPARVEDEDAGQAQNLNQVDRLIASTNDDIYHVLLGTNVDNSSNVHNATSVPSAAIVQGEFIAPDSPSLPLPPPSLTSSHVGDVHHYTGFRLYEPEFSRENSNHLGLSNIPLRNHCPHRFGFKCLDQPYPVPTPASTTTSESSDKPKVKPPIPVLSLIGTTPPAKLVADTESAPPLMKQQTDEENSPDYAPIEDWNEEFGEQVDFPTVHHAAPRDQAVLSDDIQDNPSRDVY